MQEGGCVKNARWEDEPPPVPTTATQGGETRTQRRNRWAWVEPAVWTERMLQALEEGVKGGKWFSLMDKVYAPRNLAAAFAQVKRHAQMIYREPQRAEPYAITPSHRDSIVPGVHDGVNKGSAGVDHVSIAISLAI